MATIKVEITFDPKKESLRQALSSLLDETFTAAENKQPDSLSDTPVTTETTNAPMETEAPTEAPTESASDKAPEQPTISKADVRALACTLSKNDKPALKAIFKELGVANFSAVKEEDYPVFYEKLTAANAKAVPNG